MPLVISKGLMQDNVARVKCKANKKRRKNVKEDKICLLSFLVSALGSVSVLVVQLKLINE